MDLLNKIPIAPSGRKLDRGFYLDEEVVRVARNLLGKVLYTDFGEVTGGLITETEAYAGVVDKASHAYNNRRTSRTRVMYYRGGVAYVYLCYGIHHLFNIVTNEVDIPHAVLVRGIFPVYNLPVMAKRLGRGKIGWKQTDGPGKLSRALGLHVRNSGEDLTGDRIWLEDHGLEVTGSDIISGPRVGVDYAGEDAALPYRFRLPVDKIK